ncbi:MAG: hypothetical protein AAFZ06_16455, partial [Pseudomonadota bacterium]
FERDIEKIISQRDLGAEAETGIFDPSAPAEIHEGSRIDPAVLGMIEEALGAEALPPIIYEARADLTASLDVLNDPQRRDNREDVRATTHVMASVAGTIGALHLQRLAETLNRAAHDGDDVTMAQAREATLDEISNVFAELASMYQEAA